MACRFTYLTPPQNFAKTEVTMAREIFSPSSSDEGHKKLAALLLPDEFPITNHPKNANPSPREIVQALLANGEYASIRIIEDGAFSIGGRPEPDFVAIVGRLKITD